MRWPCPGHGLAKTHAGTTFGPSIPAPRTTGIGLLLLLGLVWGFSYLFIDVGLVDISPILFAALRFDLAAAGVVAVALVRTRGKLMPPGRAAWTAIGIAAVFNISGYHALLFWGQQFTSPGVAAIIVGLNPILTMVASRFLLPGERVGLGGLLGLVLGFSGIVALAVMRNGTAFDAQGVAELVVVGAIASWAVGAVLVKRTGHSMPVASFVAWHMVVGALLLHAASLFLEPQPRLAWTTTSVGALVYLGLVASAGGFMLFFRIVAAAGPIRANLVSYLTGIVASVAAWPILGYPIEARMLVAFALIVTGFALAFRGTRQPGVSEPARPEH